MSSRTRLNYINFIKFVIVVFVCISFGNINAKTNSKICLYYQR